MYKKNQFNVAPICPPGQNLFEIIGNGTCNTQNGIILSCNNTPFVNYRCGVADICPSGTIQNIHTIKCNNISGCNSTSTSITCM
jgi:hypothetical protein